MPGRVLSVASESVPLIKTGGLADVVGALPGALAPRGWEMRVLIPAYRGLAKALGRTRPVWSARDLFGGPARVLAGQAGGIPILLLEAAHLYDRPGGPYGNPADFPDNPERFAALSWVAAEIATSGLSDGWRPDLVHAHDWQAGLAPAYLRYRGAATPTILTIHNIAFQGLAPADRLARLKLPAREYSREGFEYWGQISTLKATGWGPGSRRTSGSGRFA
jgi:starch synthase